ncbi:hypothetical protein J1N35_040971 [Gossypium stocksii]|uniref:RNase H type-1 domain-containing protein n=1 Tax=Gossypium stocksii TaxID=47602 RepID=A0A9D3UF49_9ROSI|nr:hypothetical protein J1N35_040971 [Gossypium stocksii]
MGDHISVWGDLWISEAETDRLQDDASIENPKGHKQIERSTRVTVYFDAAFDKRSFRSASGLVVRNVMGEILASKTVIHSEIPSPFLTKAHARLQAIQFVSTMGFNILEIVGDSRTVITKCQTIGPDKSILGAIIRDIQSKKVYLQEIDFHFIPKSKNEYAHFLVQEALKKGEGHYLLGVIPGHVHRERENRKLRQPA